jgi:hypothetical protein
MSDDMADAQQQDIHAVLKNLKRTDPNNRFVKLSGIGPMTVHSTDVLRNSEGFSSGVEPWVLPPKVGKKLDHDSRSGKIAAWVEERGPKIVSDYLRKFSPNGVPYISPDAAKELIPEYIEDPTDANLDAGAGAGAITHAAWDSLLAKKPEPGKDAVIISIGSPASGKTTGIISENQHTAVGVTRETIPHDIFAISKTLDEAIASGRRPVLILTFTEDPKINMERAIKRALKEGRTVPLDYMATAWLNQPKIAAEALNKYGDRIDVYAVDNSAAVGEAKIYAEDVSVALDAISAYSDRAVIEAQNEVLEQSKSTIPANIYEGFRGSVEKTDSSGGVVGNRASISGEPDRGIERKPTEDQRSQKLIPLEVSRAIAEAYLDSLNEGAKAAHIQNQYDANPSESTYAELRKLKKFTMNGVTIVKRSNLGPITVHSTGSSDTSTS